RFESFAALADLSTQVPAVRQVAAARDQAEFGFGNADADATHFDEMHASLRDADWSAWNAALDRGHVAVADYKGRLCYSSADPAASRIDVRGVAAIAAAYQPRGRGMSAQVLPADDPTLVASRLVTRRSGLELVFARAAMLAG